MKKAPEAFRTISEVAEILDTPAHVLRFWESKFYQIRPVKRAGGRRYYRPDDVALISGIKALLQDQGMTIRGVQRVLQEQGVRHVVSLAGSLPALELGGIIEGHDTPEDSAGLSPREAEGPEDQDALETLEDTVIPFQAPPPKSAVPEAAEPDEEREDEALPLDVLFAPQDEPAEGGSFADAAAEAAEDPPAGTLLDADEDPAERLDTAPAPDITPDHVIDLEEPALAASTADSLEPSDRAMLARRLRGLPRGALGPRRDRAELLARRIDALLERMSEASGAGRW